MWTTASCCPSLFELKAGNFYVALAGEGDRVQGAEDHPADHLQAGPARLHRGHRDRYDPRIETPEEVRDLILEAAQLHPHRAAGHHGRLRLLTLLATTRRPPGTRRSRRSGRGSWARGLASEAARSLLSAGHDEEERAPPLRRDPEREEPSCSPVSGLSRSCFAPSRSWSARRRRAARARYEATWRRHPGHGRARAP